MRYLISVFFLLLSFSSFAQQKQIDSLKQQQLIHKNDTMGVKCLIDLAGLVYEAGPTEAEAYCRQAYATATTISYPRGVMDAGGWLAFLFEQQGKIDSALAYYMRSIEIAKQNGYKKDLATCYNNVAAIYKDQGKIPEALEYHQRCLALRTQLKDQVGIGTSYNNIGLLYYNLGQVQEALSYYNKSLKIAEKEKDDDGFNTVIYNIATLYRDQGQYTEALDYLQKSLSGEKAKNDKYNMGYTLNVMGQVYEKQGDLNKALDVYKQALQLRQEIDDKQGLAYTQRNMADLYNKTDSSGLVLPLYLQSLDNMKLSDSKAGQASVLNRIGNFYFTKHDIPNALKYASMALTMARELGFPDAMRDAALLLNKIYRGQQNWSQAIAMNDLYIQMRDSIQNTETRKAAYKDKISYEYEKKELALKKEQEKKDLLIRQQKWLNNVYLVGLVFVLLLALLIYNRYRVKAKANNIISAEKKRSDELLKNILPDEVAEELKNKGSSDARLFDQVTVLFTDFVNFTTVSERLSPTQLVSELDTCFKAFDAIIGKYSVEKIKTVGDAYLAVAGLPGADPAHAEHILYAAMEIREYIRQRKAALGANSFDIRIGVHSGSVVAGIVGVKKFAYDIWGDAVNTAARMEQHSSPGHINVSSATHELVKDKFRFEYRGKIDAKNKGLIDMYFLLEASA